MRVKKIFLFGLFLLTTVSCHKNDINSCADNDWNYSYIDNQMNDVFFKEGSYWILKDDSLNTVDSIILRNAESGCEPVYMYQGWGSNWEYYKMDYYCYSPGSHNYYDHYYDMIESNVMMRNQHPSEYPYNGWVLYSTIPDTTLSLPFELPKRIDSIIIENHTFYKIQRSGNTYFKNQFKAIDNVYLYIAANIGIVRKVVMDSTGTHIWNLIRWKINK